MYFSLESFHNLNMLISSVFVACFYLLNKFSCSIYFLFRFYLVLNVCFSAFALHCYPAVVFTLMSLLKIDVLQ